MQHLSMPALGALHGGLCVLAVQELLARALF